MNIELVKRCDEVALRIERARQNSPRPASTVHIIAASKKQPSETINQYILWARSKGLPAIIGENYVQEFRRKRETLLPVDEVHLIGPLQSNKVREAVRLFDVIESVYSVDLLRSISQEGVKQGKTVSVFLQVNVSRDANKFGFDPADLNEAYSACENLPAVQLRGLMTITQFYDSPEGGREDYRLLARLRGERKLELSMGMSADFEVAIQEGATHVRVGTSLFGARS